MPRPTDSLTQESEQDIINLPDDESNVIKLLIQYLYESEYEPLLPENDSSTTATSASIVHEGSRPKQDLNGNRYSYEFPHTCNLFNGLCAKRLICPHHTCSHDVFFRTGSYNRCCSNFDCGICNPPAPPLPLLNGTSDQLLLHAKMYEIAEKYDVGGLKELVIEKFSRACEHFWDDAKFSVAAYHVFSTTPDHDKGLRDVISGTIASHMKALVKKPEIETLLTEFNGLAYGLLKVKIDAGWE
jgi:hypothetical protein